MENLSPSLPIQKTTIEYTPTTTLPIELKTTTPISNTVLIPTQTIKPSDVATKASTKTPRKYVGYNTTDWVVTVTCYFHLKTAKHSGSQYEDWIEKFFRQLGDGAAVIFTTRSTQPTLEAIAIKYLQVNRTKPLVFVTDYESPLDFPPIKPYAHLYETSQHSIDPEKKNPQAILICHLEWKRIYGNGSY